MAHRLTVLQVNDSHAYLRPHMELFRGHGTVIYRQMGGYVKRCLGLTAYVKVENPPGYRIEELFVDGRRVDDKESYEACYITVQGVPERYGGNRQDLDVDAVGALRNYLAVYDPAHAGLHGSIVPV